MEPKVSLPFAQRSNTSAYPQTDLYSPRPLILFLEYLILFQTSYLFLGFPNDLLPLDLPTENVYEPRIPPKRATYPGHLIFYYLKDVWRGAPITKIVNMVSCFSLWSLLFSIIKSPVTHHYISCFSLWILLFLITKSPVYNYEVSCFSLWNLLFLTMKCHVSNYEVSCYSSWNLLFLIMKSPVSYYKVSRF